MPEEIRRRYQAALDYKAQFHGMFRDAYQYVFPGRPGFENAAPGQSDMHEIYDSTAVVGAADLAARLQGWVAPIEGRWLELQPGIGGDADPKELELLSDRMFAALSASALDVQLYEALQDLVVSTGALRIMDGGIDRQLDVQAVPLSRLALEAGPFDSVAGIYATWLMTAENVRRQWPDAGLEENAARDVEVVEATVRDYGRRDTEVWRHYTFLRQPELVLDDREFVGQGSLPWVIFRWAKAPGEVYGRGPVLHALPDIKVLNYVVELTLENAEMAIAGMYNADDDGVTNPASIKIQPGTIVPRQPGSTGLEPIASPSRFDVSQMVLADLRAAVRRAFFADTATPPDARTPPTATQIMQFQTEQMTRLSPPVARLGTEFYRAIAARVLHILHARGEIPVPPRLDPNVVRVKPVSPMATVKALEELDRTNRCLDLVGARSPDAMQLTFDMERYAEYVAEVLGVPAHLVRTPSERKAHVERVAQIAQQVQQEQVA